MDQSVHLLRRMGTSNVAIAETNQNASIDDCFADSKPIGAEQTRNHPSHRHF